MRPNLLYGLVGAALLALILFLTDPYFSILDDETSIVFAANAPIAQTLKLFATGQTLHEHPPLSDLLLHLWRPVAGVSSAMIRLPFIIFYSLGLVTFAAAAQKMAGTTAFYTMLLFGMLWPFGFHFGRLAGWYSFCFLMIGVLTVAYLHFLDSPSWGRWLLVIIAGFAAVASNYFCWLVVAVIMCDLFVTLEPRVAVRYTAGGTAILAAAYGPLWISLAHELRMVDPAASGHGILETFLNAGFNLYAVFISESVAPWFWALSIPATLAIAGVLIGTPFLIEGRTRRFYFAFLGLFGAMAAFGIIGTKRLLFISGWLLVGIGCALANSRRPGLRAVLAASLLVTIAAGWVGIFSRKHYASLHYVEPWATLAREAAQNIGKGQVVVSNSPSFLFDLNASLYESRLSANHTAGWASGPNVISLVNSEVPATFPEKEIMFVVGVNTLTARKIALAESWMTSHCRLPSIDRLLRDDGFELKKKYFHVEGDDPYRIHVEEFDCRR